MSLYQKRVDTKLLDAISNIQCDHDVTISSVGTTEKSLHVDFPRPYPAGATPTVLLTLTASYNRRIHVANVTNTGFDAVAALSSGTATVWFNWLAYWGVFRNLRYVNRLSPCKGVGV